MRKIDEIASLYPNLDLASIRILLQIHETPGRSITDIADILRLDFHFVRQKIAIMAKGRGAKTRCRPLGLITVQLLDVDMRKRELTLTETGEALAQDLLPLTKRRG